MADRDVGGANDPDKTREEVSYDLDFRARTIDKPAVCCDQPVKGSKPSHGVPTGGGRTGYAVDD